MPSIRIGVQRAAISNWPTTSARPLSRWRRRAATSELR